MISRVMVEQTKDDLRHYKDLLKEVENLRLILEEEEYKQAGVTALRTGENVPNTSMSDHARVLDNMDKIEAIQARINDCQDHILLVNFILTYLSEHYQHAHHIIVLHYFENKRYDEIADMLGERQTRVKRAVNTGISLALRSRFHL